VGVNRTERDIIHSLPSRALSIVQMFVSVALAETFTAFYKNTERRTDHRQCSAYGLRVSAVNECRKQSQWNLAARVEDPIIMWN
jgi:hypothetical protein